MVKRVRTRTQAGIKRRRPIDTTTLEGLAAIARKAGFKKEAERAVGKPKLSFFQRLGRGLTAFETGNAVYQSRYEKGSFLKTFARDIGRGLKAAFTGREARTTPKKTYKDILLREGFKDRPGKLDAVDVLGLVADIATDPLTYFGGFLGKGVTKGAAVTIKAGKRVPVLGKAIRSAQSVTEDLFKPFAKVERLAGGKKYVDSFQKYAKGTRAETDAFIEVVAKRARGVKKIPEAGIKIGVAIEAGIKTGNKLLDESLSALVRTQKKFTTQEVERGILQHQLPDYMHHMLTTEAADFIQKGGDLAQFIKPIRVRLGAAKARKLKGLVEEINKEYQKRLGFKIFEENAFEAFAKRGIDSIRAVNTFDFIERIGVQFGKKTGKNFIDEVGVKWIESGVPQLKGVRVPEAIAKHLDDTQKFLTNDEATNSLLRLYDKALRLWKGTVTGYFPAFHTRNAMGGMFNNWIAGIKDPRFYLQTEKVLGSKLVKAAPDNVVAITSKTGQKYTYGQIRRLLNEYGVVGQTGFLDVRQYLAKEVTPTIGKKITRAPMKVMGVVENRLRTPLFLDGLARGLDPADAARRVIKYHFDYMPEGFTAFERNVMKRVIPFYTWTRHNIPLQIEQMIMQPGKYAGVFKTQRAFGLRPTSEEEELLPAWLKDKFTIKAEGGFWSGIGLPLEEATEKLANPLRGFGISLSPFIKVPIEQLTGYNIFKERRIDEDTFGKHFRNIPKPMQNWLQLKKHKSKSGKVYYTVNPKRKYWLEVVGSRSLSTALRVSNYTDDKKNLLSLITTIKKYEYDIDDLRRWSEADQREELEKLLLEAGVLQEFRRTFVPK